MVERLPWSIWVLLAHATQVLTLYESAVFGEMSFLHGDVACASVVAEVLKISRFMRPFLQ